MKKLTLRMNRIYKSKDRGLSDSKFINYHKHHLIVKHLMNDLHPKEDERTILILSEGMGNVLRSIELIPFSYILVVDPNFKDYKLIDIEGKKVIKIGLPHIILIQILQTIRIKIDALFLPILDFEKVDFLTEMVFPVMKDEFYFISNRTTENVHVLNYYVGKFANLPFEFAYEMEQDLFENLFIYCFDLKRSEQTQFFSNGKKVVVVHDVLWSKIDSVLQVVFTQFPDDGTEFLLSLYENDLYSVDGKYKSADNNVVYNLKKIDALEAMVAKCGFESVGFTLHPNVWEKVERIIRSDNSVKDVYVFGFFNNPNDQIPTFLK